MIWRVVITMCLLLASSGQARADVSLELTDVLDSVQRSHPKAALARAKVKDARARALSERGAFDPRVQVKSSLQPTGYYEQAQAQVGVLQRVPGTGVSLHGQHRWSGGDIQEYYGEKETLSGGELSMRMVVPLLANRSNDRERTAIRIADVDARLAHVAEDAALRELYLAATLAYYEWAASAQRMTIAGNLLEIAEKRAETISEQVERGALAGIQRVDARRVLLARRSKVLEARSKFIGTQQKLSLYYRNETLEPVLVDESRAPHKSPNDEAIGSKNVGALVRAALARRPELLALEERRQRARAQLNLAANQRLPTLNLELFAARDLGTGDPRLRQTETGVSVFFELPIGRRKAKGKEQQARAKLAAIDATLRGLRDRISVELHGLATLAELRGQQADLAEERWRATEQLAQAERIRLEEGGSDLLTVTLRERDVATSASDAVNSALERNKALAQLRFVAGLLPPGLNSERTHQ